MVQNGSKGQTGPVILPQSNYAEAGSFANTYPSAVTNEAQTAAAVMEDTKSFLNRIRREADQRVSEAIKSAEKEQDQDEKEEDM